MSHSQRITHIGSVDIDITNWAGKELYSDGAIETELLERLKDGESIESILKRDRRYPVLYHFSRERWNLLNWAPLPKDGHILEVGSGCGALTGLLIRRCAQVTAVDLSKTRSEINAYRHIDSNNLHLIVGNLSDLPMEPKYDAITLIGVLEYAALYTAGENPYVALLEQMRNRLKPSGQLWIAIENQFGIKYFAGAREDHLWKLYAGLEGYHDASVRTFGKDSLSNLLTDSGFVHQCFFYPNPDYKMPRQILSDDGAEFYEQISGPYPDFGEYVYRSFDQRDVLLELNGEGCLPKSMNSFLVQASADAHVLNTMLFTKHASLRSDAFALTTQICQVEANRLIKKTAITSAALHHIDNIINGSQLLMKRAPEIRVEPCYRDGDSVVSAYVPGEMLSVVYAAATAERQSELLARYCALIDAFIIPAPIVFSKHPEFQSIFGDMELPPMLCTQPSPIDLTMENLLVTHDSFVAVDTEWVFDMPIPRDYILWRSAHQFCERYGGDFEQLLGDMHVDLSCCSLYEQLEARFRDYAFDETSPFSLIDQYQTRTPNILEILSRAPGPFVSRLLEKRDDIFVEESAQSAILDHDKDTHELIFDVSAFAKSQILHWIPLQGWMSRITIQALDYVDEYGGLVMAANVLAANAQVYGSTYCFETYVPYCDIIAPPKHAVRLIIRCELELLGDMYAEEVLNRYRAQSHELTQENQIYQGQLAQNAELFEQYVKRSENDLAQAIHGREAMIDKHEHERTQMIGEHEHELKQIIDDHEHELTQMIGEHEHELTQMIDEHEHELKEMKSQRDMYRDEVVHMLSEYERIHKQMNSQRDMYRDIIGRHAKLLDQRAKLLDQRAKLLDQRAKLLDQHAKLLFIGSQTHEMQQQHIDRSRDRVRQLEVILRDYRYSSSWRITRPWRFIGMIIHALASKLFRKGKNE